MQAGVRRRHEMPKEILSGNAKVRRGPRAESRGD